MVVVSMAFIGIVVGALLTAAGYAYRLRMQDLNARDNFYYVEHAMEEVYAGVGSETLVNMQDAYVYTVENMVRYDVATQSYVNISNDDAEKMFKDKFMENLSTNDFFAQATIADSLEKFITDSSVELDPSRLYIQRDYVTKDGVQVLDKITIKNVTLKRTVKYDRSAANGDYTQTISTDIEIGNPDFDVLFNAAGGDSTNIFGFALVADMGVEINENQPVTIAGNIYAASDYYNKKYNESTYDDTVSDDTKSFTASNNIEYKHGSVTSKTYTSENNNTYYNMQGTINNPLVPGEKEYYDGVNKRSMYSGLFIDRTDVSILADMVIVPGTIAVMDTGSLSVFGKNGMSVSESEVWADNVILGGYSSRVFLRKDNDGNDVYSYNGASANIRANMYIKDDTELNATASDFKLRGKYYGYGDSTMKDSRTFIPTVDLDNFQRDYVVYDTNGNVVKQNGQTVFEKENRGHYNSSAIIVNGERSVLNLEETSVLYLAGRAYIELSKNVTSDDFQEKDGNGTVTGDYVNRQTIEFVPEGNNFDTTDPNDTEFLRDYKTGESLTLKTNQLAYIPVQYTGMPTPAVALDGNVRVAADDYGNTRYDADLHPALRGSALFEKYFPAARFVDANDKYGIPCIMQEVSGKKYYYYDFERAYNMIRNAAAVLGPGVIDSAAFVTEFPSAEAYAAGFIKDYVAELNDPNSVIKEYLTDISDYDGFEAGTISIPRTGTDSFVYSSGAITTKSDTAFDVVVDNATNLSTLFSSQNGFEVNGTLPADYSKELAKEYNFVKWNLGHFSDTAEADNEKLYITEMLEDDDFGEASITPINRFLNYDSINTTKRLNLSSEYYVVYSNQDVVVNETGVVKGIILTKGDVTFGPDVTGFEGLIVAGGKVYITGKVQTITASAEICRAILRECQLSGDDDCKTFLKLFKGYEDSSIISDDNNQSAKTIDTIDYSDVVKFNNWMKNVE